MRLSRPRPSQQVQSSRWLVDDAEGLHIGRLEVVYEDQAGTASWLLVRLARFSSRYALVPPASVLAVDGRIWIPYTRETVERAPQLYEPAPAVGGRLEQETQAHYGLLGDAKPEIRASAGRTAA